MTKYFRASWNTGDIIGSQKAAATKSARNDGHKHYPIELTNGVDCLTVCLYCGRDLAPHLPVRTLGNYRAEVQD